MPTIQKTDALVIVDPQNDFCPGGALAVAGGDEIMSAIATLTARFRQAGATVVITQDYHPADHKSFASNHEGAQPFSITQMPYGDQVLWPDHCIQGSHGTEFHPAIDSGLDSPVGQAHLIIRKGMNPEIDSYSAFYENDKTTATGLAGYLGSRGIKRVFFVGLAYDFCVGYSALDAASEGFRAFVVGDLTRAIDMPTLTGSTVTDIEAAFARNGVAVIESGEIG